MYVSSCGTVPDGTDADKYYLRRPIFQIKIRIQSKEVQIQSLVHAEIYLSTGRFVFPRKLNGSESEGIV